MEEVIRGQQPKLIAQKSIGESYGNRAGRF